MGLFVHRCNLALSFLFADFLTIICWAGDGEAEKPGKKGKVMGNTPYTDNLYMLVVYFFVAQIGKNCEREGGMDNKITTNSAKA